MTENKALMAENTALKNNNDELKKQIMLHKTEAPELPLLEAPKIVGGPPPPPPPPMPSGMSEPKDWRKDHAAKLAKEAADKEAAAAAAATHVDTPEEEEATRERAKKKVEAMARANASARAAMLQSAPAADFIVSSKDISAARSSLKKTRQLISPRQNLTRETATTEVIGRTPNVARSAAPMMEQKSTRHAIKTSIRGSETSESESKSLEQVKAEADKRKAERGVTKRKETFDKLKSTFENNPFAVGGKGTRRRYNNYKKTRKGRVNNRRRKIKSRKSRKIKTFTRQK
jgi:hypothetical protein